MFYIMKTNEDYINDYNEAYRAMKERAIELMKERGGILEVLEVGKKLIMKENGYHDESEIYEDELEDWKCENLYCCTFEGKHEDVYLPNIYMVRYNEKFDDLDAYLEDEYDLAEWVPASMIGFGRECLYMTVLEYI
jgi:hypothetical protein